MSLLEENPVLVSVRTCASTTPASKPCKASVSTSSKAKCLASSGPTGRETTTIEILEGLRQPDGVSVSVCSLDPASQSAALKERIGAQLQSTVLPDKMRVDEALNLFATFYKHPVCVLMLLDQFGLTEKRRTYFEHLSGGQKQRLALALALVNDPELVLLDEPTVGLDPQLRHDIHDLVERFREEGRTVLLTTHYIEEAERLCDRVAIMDRGRLVVLGHSP